MYEISRAQELWARDRAPDLPTRAQRLTGGPTCHSGQESKFAQGGYEFTPVTFELLKPQMLKLRSQGQYCDRLNIN